MINIYLLNPRGFCAGVTRAVQIVEKSIEKFDINKNNKLYIRHEIVHNKTIVNDLKNRGIVFVNEINEIPENSITIFSAHGVSQKLEDEAKTLNLPYIDATCPLVKKIHKEGIKYHQQGYFIILIGHKGHPELEGTLGRIPDNIVVVENEQEAKSIKVPDNMPICYLTQTTLSLDDTKHITDILHNRFPNIQGLSNKNICYATQNRQNALKSVIDKIDFLIVVGSQNSSNSNRLKEIGEKNQIKSYLIDNDSELPLDEIKNYKNIAITAGASAPETMVQKIINKIKSIYAINLIEHNYIEENTMFFLPKQLRD